MRLKTFLMIILLLVIGQTVASAPAAAQGSNSLSVWPSSGPPGSTFTIAIGVRSEQWTTYTYSIDSPGAGDVYAMGQKGSMNLPYTGSDPGIYSVFVHYETLDIDLGTIVEELSASFSVTSPPDCDGDGNPDITDACPCDLNHDPVGDPCNHDTDSDGVDDWNDPCPYDPAPGTPNGCPITECDTDGIPDASDVCPCDANHDSVGDPCNHDEDGDGVDDWNDACPTASAPGTGNGCPPLPPDCDGDGNPDATDLCPCDLNHDSVGNACNHDEDGDGVDDWNDACPTDGAPGTGNGCPPLDEDNDGLPNTTDPCPLDPNHDAVGNPCNHDEDGDGVGDWNDDCPVEQGVSSNGGCPEATPPPPVDSDGDGFPDDVDRCPDEAAPDSADGCPVKGPTIAPPTAIDLNTVFGNCPDIIPQLERLPLFVPMALSASEDPCGAANTLLSALVFFAPFDALAGQAEIITECASAAAALDSFLDRVQEYDPDLASRLQATITPSNRCAIGQAIQSRVLPPLDNSAAWNLPRLADLRLRRAFSEEDLRKVGALECLIETDNAHVQAAVDSLNATGITSAALAAMGSDMCRYMLGVIDIPAGALSVSTECQGENVVLWVYTGQGPMNVYGTGPGLPLSLTPGKTLLYGPATWENLVVSETTGDLETFELGNIACPVANDRLDLVHDCDGSDLIIWPTGGDGPFNVAGSGPGLPVQTFYGPQAFAGPGTWSGVTVMEIGGDKEFQVLGDISCPAPLQATLGCVWWDPSQSLQVDILNGDSPFQVTAGGPEPQQVSLSWLVGYESSKAVFLARGPGSWTGVTVTELGGDGESVVLGDMACPVGKPGTLFYETYCEGSDLVIWPEMGDAPFEVSGNGSGLPLQTLTQRTVLYGPGTWTDLKITETGGDKETQIIGDRTCPATLSATVRCSVPSLAFYIQDGETPLMITGTGPELPYEVEFDPGGGYGTNFGFSRPGVWKDITITEMSGDGETLFFPGPFTCPSTQILGQNVYADVSCVGNDLRIWPVQGGTTFNVIGSGPGLPFSTRGGESILPGPATWREVQITDAAGVAEPFVVGEVTCPQAFEPLDARLLCYEPVVGYPETVEIRSGDGPFEVTGNGPSLPCQVHTRYDNSLPRYPYTDWCGAEPPFEWTDVVITELGGDGETLSLSDLTCPPGGNGATQTLSTSAACFGDTLLVRINNGSGPFDVTGSGPDLPQRTNGGSLVLKGPATWTDVSVSELMGDVESVSLGDFTCGAASPPPAIVCGDGKVDSPEEQCEPSLSADCDPTTCKWIAQCGNGRVDTGEDCEPPGLGSCDDACHATLIMPIATCGDSQIEAPEECDPPDGTVCDGRCMRVRQCGNGRIDQGESCEPPGQGSCDAQCQQSGEPVVTCGDGVIQSPETCDPPAEGTCSADCQLVATCGNGQIEPGETCEPPGQGTCSADCLRLPVLRAAVCGNGILERGEVCEPSLDSTCQTNCRYVPLCGNGKVEESEECDSSDSATCDATCHTIKPLAADDKAQLPEVLTKGLIQAVLVGQASPADLFLLQGGKLEQLTMDTPQGELFPAMDATMKLVAYVEVEESGHTRLKVMNLANRFLTTLFDSTSELAVAQYPVAWSPDGKTMLVTLTNEAGEASIYSLDLSTSISNTPVLVAQSASSPSFAPNGLLFAYEQPVGDSRIIKVMMASSPTTNSITQEGSVCHDPAFAEDSLSLFFVCDTEAGSTLYRYGMDGIVEVPAGVTNPANPAPGPGYGYLAFDDGGTIYFGRDDGSEIAPMLTLEGKRLSQFGWPTLRDTK